MPSHLEAAIEIAREAGALLAAYFERRVPFELKGEFDLVTEADRASEKLVVERLQSRFPQHGIVAEEGGGHTSPSEYRWYVDPLDGTTNFAHSFPIFNVTLALERAGEMVVGVVFDPIRQEMFTAERGSGAWLHDGLNDGQNNRRIGVSSVSRLDSSLLCTGFPTRRRHLNVNVHFYHQLAMATHGVRRTGRHRPGVGGLRTPGRVLGIRTEALGYGGGQAAGRRSRRSGIRYAWQAARFRLAASVGG